MTTASIWHRIGLRRWRIFKRDQWGELYIDPATKKPVTVGESELWATLQAGLDKGKKIQEARVFCDVPGGAGLAQRVLQSLWKDSFVCKLQSMMLHDHAGLIRV